MQKKMLSKETLLLAYKYSSNLGRELKELLRTITCITIIMFLVLCFFVGFSLSTLIGTAVFTIFFTIAAIFMNSVSGIAKRKTYTKARKQIENGQFVVRHAVVKSVEEGYSKNSVFPSYRVRFADCPIWCWFWTDYNNGNPDVHIGDEYYIIIFNKRISSNLYGKVGGFYRCNEYELDNRLNANIEK